MISKNIHVEKLTGLPNFISFFRADFKSIYGEKGYLLYFKVKPLKLMNEKYGRDQVDRVFMSVGAFLRDKVTQPCFKHEGNGFLIVYKNKNDDLAKVHIEELSKIIERQKVKLNLNELKFFPFLMGYNKPIRSVADYYQLFFNIYKQENNIDDDSELFHYIVQGLSYRINDMIDENSKVREFALIDEISTLPNSKSAAIHFEKIEKNSSNYTILFIDGDNLKKFNDVSYECGNNAIRRIANVINNSVRKSDKVFRWLSGDEFIVVAEGTSYDETVELAERIRSNVENDFLRSEITATISIGISRYPDDANTIKAIINNAELANKKAKVKGKNRFVMFDSSLV